MLIIDDVFATTVFGEYTIAVLNCQLEIRCDSGSAPGLVLSICDAFGLIQHGCETVASGRRVGGHDIYFVYIR